MNDVDWRIRLEEFFVRVLTRADAIGEGAWGRPRALRALRDKMCRGEAVWLGRAGASEEAILAAETRLGVALPESYREFLKISNGFYLPGYYVREILPVEEVRRLRDSNPELVKIAEYAFPEEAPQSRIGEMLQLTGEYDGIVAYLLLDPRPEDLDLSVLMFNPEETDFYPSVADALLGLFKDAEDWIG